MHTTPPRASSRLSTPFVALAALAALALLTFRVAPAEIEEATARRFEAIKAWRAGDKEGAKKIAVDKASSAKQAVVDAKAEYDEFQEWKKTHPRPAEKVGWMPFAQAGAETGGNFMAQGLDTSFRFFTDPSAPWTPCGCLFTTLCQHPPTALISTTPAPRRLRLPAGGHGVRRVLPGHRQ
ncbi:hypothetical protein EMIHUDRAFT_424023 [Emiliania huxleyi CCMP1516]|uniref:PSI-F n=2 Tax=Emiliania huxleyi TaxID=2903 RepID=A0A0D3K1Z6_EMIH1|nr:hypothetical protein EMIHUDRAFT_424023 [Emiliania huxleyi CCMP1516]EOD29781.1 hypothetical protein EMIHUDRAFT_424023 [Emiliania huxleyi CCMP1516]|eukprot:XP_005782210.1 hypothetical protein EMIHUDRAFT_424023 [Emiliania huxleyi CCMP1516]